MLTLLYVFITCNKLKYILKEENILNAKGKYKKKHGTLNVTINFYFNMYITFTLYHFKPLFNFSF